MSGKGKNPPTSLAGVQQFMQAALMQPGNALQLAQQVQDHIAPGTRLNAGQHLAIYQRAYYARLLQCLQGQYKALFQALGLALFNDFAYQYLQQNPSRSATLALLGQDFAGYLQRTRPDADSAEKESWIDFMVDLASFEWTLYTLFDAPGSEAQGYANEPDELQHPQLRLQTCLRLCRYRYPVSSYYQQVSAMHDSADTEPPLPPQQASWLALVRSDYKIGIFTLLPAQYHLLKQLEQAGPGFLIGDALQNTAQAFGKSLDVVERGWANWRLAWGAAGFFEKIGKAT